MGAPGASTAAALVTNLPLDDFIEANFAVSRTYGDYDLLTRVDIAG